MLSSIDHGFGENAWKSAKQEAKAILLKRARLRGLMPYSELAGAITSIQIEPHDNRFFHFLGEVSSEEDDAGRGMLTSIVVHKTGDMIPGPGFFELAESRGRDTSDILKTWISEVQKVHAHWSLPKSEG